MVTYPKTSAQGATIVKCVVNFRLGDFPVSAEDDRISYGEYMAGRTLLFRTDTATLLSPREVYLSQVLNLRCNSAIHQREASLILHLS